MIMGYRSMLSAVFRFKLPEISTSPVLQDLLRSFQVEAQSRSIQPPSWDLNKVLVYLRSPTFEPLQPVSLRSLSKKVLFLLSLATAKRVSELQALSSIVSFSSEGAVVSYVPEFLAKTESALRPLPRSFLVESLTDFAAGLDEGLLLCPVRCLRVYLQRTSPGVKRPRRLFVSLRNPSRLISKNAISYFLREVIAEVGPSSETGVVPRAHSIRGVATSAAFHRNWSISSVLNAACWRSSSVFTSFYLKDLYFEINGYLPHSYFRVLRIWVIFVFVFPYCIFVLLYYCVLYFYIINFNCICIVLEVSCGPVLLTIWVFPLVNCPLLLHPSVQSSAVYCFCGTVLTVP